jgi:hypothetical protein
MSPEERQVLVELFQRTNAAASQPRDRDAEAFIAEAVRLQPYAPYLLAQAVLLQEQAMKQASERLQQLEAENRDLQERVAQGVAQAGQQAPQGGFLGGLGSLFGGQQQAPQRGPEPPPRPGGPWGQAPQAAPQQQPGWGAPPPLPQGGQGAPWGGAPQQQAGGGSSFLKGALGAAAGVAGGALLVNSLSGMFGGHGHSAGLGGGLGQQAGGGTVVNNYYGDEGDGQQDSGDADYSYASDDSDYDDDDSSDDTYDA